MGNHVNESINWHSFCNEIKGNVIFSGGNPTEWSPFLVPQTVTVLPAKMYVWSNVKDVTGFLSTDPFNSNKTNQEQD